MRGLIEILKLIDTLGEIKGRTRLQKIVYILQSKKYYFPEQFGYLHHGPYSSELAAEVDSLCGSGLIEEKKPAVKNRPYIYRTTVNATKILQELNESDPRDWESLAKELDQHGVEMLEAISTIIYLLHKRCEEDSLQVSFANLKPHLASIYGKARKETKRVISLK